MYRFYRWIYDLMGFSRSQANGFLIFLPLITLIVLSEPIYRFWTVNRPINYDDDLRILDSLVAIWPPTPNDSVQFSTPIKKPNPVDPNTASMTDFVAIGLPERLAGRIISYRNKGGRFKSKEDLKKMYGMDNALLANISPYLTFPKHNIPVKESQKRFADTSSTQPLSPFDLNLADTIQLKKVKGIGSKLSVRIIRYRDALGGFTSIRQLSEIYRLDTVIIHELKKIVFIAPDFEPVKININTSTEQELSRHPYLERQEANAIVAYRFKHGKFKSLNDLADIKTLDSASTRKIFPYLECR